MLFVRSQVGVLGAPVVVSSRCVITPPPPALRGIRLWAMNRHFVPRFFAVALLLSLLLMTGCSGSPGFFPVEHRAVISEGNALIAYVTVQLPEPARVQIEYEAREDAGTNGTQPKYRTPLSDVATSHRIPVVRLRAETAYRYSVGIEERTGVAFVSEGEFTTGTLPEDLQAMQRTVTGRSTLPLILTDYNTEHSNYFVALDSEGEIVWYFEHRRRQPRPDGTLHNIRRTGQGNFIYMVYRCCIIEITPLGEELQVLLANEVDGVPHHDFQFLDDGRVLYAAWFDHVFDDSANGGSAETVRPVDTLRIWDPVNGGSEKVWDSRDHWDISDPGQRARWADGFSWTHLNTINFNPDGDLILSLRNRNQVIALSPDYKHIRWSLGGPGGDFDFPNAGDRFFFAHTPTQLPNGNILLFDNGLINEDMESPYIKGLQAAGALERRAEEYSRAIELRLDREAGSAVKVWEYRATPDIFSSILSNADRLPNGNTLVSFGSTPRAAIIPSAIMEVSPDGETVFRLNIVDPRGEDWRYPRRYRAYARFDSIMGETRVE